MQGIVRQVVLLDVLPYILSLPHNKGVHFHSVVVLIDFNQGEMRPLASLRPPPSRHPCQHAELVEGASGRFDLGQELEQLQVDLPQLAAIGLLEILTGALQGLVHLEVVPELEEILGLGDEVVGLREQVESVNGDDASMADQVELLDVMQEGNPLRPEARHLHPCWTCLVGSEGQVDPAQQPGRLLLPWKLLERFAEVARSHFAEGVRNSDGGDVEIVGGLVGGHEVDCVAESLGENRWCEVDDDE
mmetsp:Transcript_12920/g.45382  ORF Transcript_12920/g.45382 Transcript_12920/m.45382 type:complete len:246 (-) Transcript_12920:156-893(-)